MHWAPAVIPFSAQPAKIPSGSCASDVKSLGLDSPEVTHLGDISLLQVPHVFLAVSPIVDRHPYLQSDGFRTCLSL